MPKLTITLEIGEAFAQRIELRDFDLAALRPDRREDLLNAFSGLVATAARDLGVWDDFVETLQMQRDEMGAAAFEELVADMNPLLRQRLVTAGILAA